jgi:hypothetical protein
MVFLILFAVDLVLGLVFSPLPHFLGNFLSSVIGGTLIAPFIAVVTTLMYFRLSSAAVGTGPMNGPAGSPGPYDNQGQYGQPGAYPNQGQYGQPGSYPNQGQYGQPGPYGS